VASCAPPIRFSNVYGIDMPSRAELVAYGRDNQSIAEEIGADHVIFQTLPDLISACQQFNPSIARFDCSVFDGVYVTGGVDEDYLTHLETLRGDNLNSQAPSVEVGSLGVNEGKGGGGVRPTSTTTNGKAVNGSAFLNGYHTDPVDRSNGIGIDNQMQVNGNGATQVDDTVGLHNSWIGGKS